MKLIPSRHERNVFSLETKNYKIIIKDLNVRKNTKNSFRSCRYCCFIQISPVRFVVCVVSGNCCATSLKISTAEFIFPRKVVRGICTASIDYTRMQGTYNRVSAPNLLDRSHGISTRQSRWSWIMERTRTIASENFDDSLADIFGILCVLYFIYTFFSTDIYKKCATWHQNIIIFWL